MSAVNNVTMSEEKNVNIDELIKEKAQLLDGVERIDKILRNQLKKEIVKHTRFDKFVVEMLRACTKDIPALGEEWIQSMQKPQFMRLFHMAFVTRKYNNCFYKDQIDAYNYEILEYFGDSLLRFMMIEILLKRFPQSFNHPGKNFCSKIIIEYCKDQNLAFVAKKLNFNLFIEALDHEKETEMDKILEDVVESFIAALYLACRDNAISRNYRVDILEAFIMFIFDDIEKKKGIFYHTCSNPKNMLNFTVIAKSTTFPRLKVLHYTTVPAECNKKRAPEELTINNFVKKPKVEFFSTLHAQLEFEDGTVRREIGTGWHFKKKEAESNAAREGIKTLFKDYQIVQTIPPGWTDFCGNYPNCLLDL